MILKTKDLFTALAIICAFATLPLASQGRIEQASIAILIATALDLADGLYARITGTSNRFGKEFDVIGDLIIFSLAPGLLLFFALDASIWLRYAIAVLPLLFGCIRLARFNVKSIEYPGFWIGLPRPGLMLLIVAFVNSLAFTATPPWMIAILVLIASLLTVTLQPYPGHHERTFTPGQKISLAILLLLTIGASAFGYFWESILAIALLYLASPILIPEDERAKLKRFIEDWRDGQA